VLKTLGPTDLNLAEILLLLNFTFLVQIKKQGLLEPNTLLKFINLLVRKRGVLEAKLYMMITDSYLTFMCFLLRFKIVPHDS
jgi:hypothetical protein